MTRSAALNKNIEDYEVLQCLQLWGFKKNTNRSNARPDGIDHVMSDTLGVIQIPSTRKTILSPSSSKFHAFTKLIATRFIQHFPDEARNKFVYSSINVNKNYAGKLHRDLANVGPSFVKAFGKFSGGELEYYPMDKGK